MDKKPLYDLVLDKMQEKIPMVLYSKQAEQEFKEFGEMLRKASDLWAGKLIIIGRIRDMTGMAVASGNGRRIHAYLVDLEFAIRRH